MVVFDGTVKSKALVCLVISHILMVLTQENYLFKKSLAENRLKRAIVEEEGKILKINKQITVLLSEKESRVFQYLDVENHDHNLSVTITPCSTTVKWSFVYHTIEELKKQNSTEFFENDGTAENYENDKMKTVTVERAKKGWYFIIFPPLEREARVSIYLTMEGVGPYELIIPQKPNLVLTPLRRQRLRVTWEPSLVNPQNMSYCLVINTRKEYPSLCGAEEDGHTIKGFEVPVIVNLRKLKLEKKKKGKFTKIERGMKPGNDTVIICVDRKIQMTITKIKRGVKYYFNLFAINNNTNLTIPYGKSFLQYNFTVKAILLKDGVQRVVDLRKLEGKSNFRFKTHTSTKELHFYVLACGGAVDVEISKKELVKRRGRKAKQSADSMPELTRVFGYKRFRILYPAEGEQYYLKVNAPNVDELTRIKYIEVFATQFPAQRYPLPQLPEHPNLYEFKSQKSCDSVTIGWVPVNDTSVNRYCVLVRENQKFNYADLFRGNYQCSLDRKRSFFASPNESSVSSECQDMVTTNKKSITNYKIWDLKPGTSYTIQVTVKKQNGRTLSYKFLRVFTKTAFNNGSNNMSFKELCENGSFLENDFSGKIEGFIVGSDFYKNQLNQLQRISLGILFFLITAVSITANGLALLTIYKRKLQILYKCCVVSQCVGDLLMAVFVGINSLNNFVQDTIDWKFGGFMCSWMPYITTMCALLSSEIITCIAIDRYQGIVLLAGKWDPKFPTAAIIVGCLWLAAAGATVPTFLSYNLKPACFLDFAANTSHFAHLCITNKIINSQYFLAIFIFIFLPLLVAFVVTYIVMARLILAKKKAVKNQQLSSSASTIDTSLDSQGTQSCCQPPQTSLPAPRDGQTKKKVRTFTIILIIMATFITCRLPQWVFLVVTSFPKYRVTGNVWWIVKYLLSGLSLTNTAINPFIYPFLNDVVHLKSNFASGLKNLKNLKLKNIRMNLTPSSGK